MIITTKTLLAHQARAVANAKEEPLGIALSEVSLSSAIIMSFIVFKMMMMIWQFQWISEKILVRADCWIPITVIHHLMFVWDFHPRSLLCHQVKQSQEWKLGVLASTTAPWQVELVLSSTCVAVYLCCRLLVLLSVICLLWILISLWVFVRQEGQEKKSSKSIQ